MDESTMSNSFSLLWFAINSVAIPFGAALYGGLVVSRYNRFYNAKDMASRMIFEIKPVIQKDDPMLRHPRVDEMLQFPVQILRDSGQMDAHYILLNVATEIGKELDQAAKDLLAGVPEVKLNKDRWEAEVRMMQPFIRSIYTVRPYQF